MKRLLATGLVSAMALSTLAGCSSAELGYLNVMRELSDATAYEGTLTMDMTFGDFISESAGISTIAMDGEFAIDSKDFYMEMSTDVSIDDKTLENPVEVIYNTDNMYISKSYYTDLMYLVNDLMMETTADESMSIEAEIDALATLLAEYEYISLLDNEMMDLYSQAFNPTYMLSDPAAANTLVYDYIEDTFADFETDIITQSGDTYTIELDAQKAADLLVDLVEYTYENKDKVYDNTANLAVDVYELTGLAGTVEGDMTYPTVEEIEAEIDAMKEIALAEIDGMYMDMQAEDDFAQEIAMVVDMLAGSYMKVSVSADDDVITENLEMFIQLDLTDMFGLTQLPEGMTAEDLGIPTQPMDIMTITADVEYNKVDEIEDKKEIDPAKAINMMEAMNLMEKAAYMANPVENMDIMWYDDYVAEGSMYSDLFINHQDGDLTYDIAEYFVEEGRIYLPMRQITETFGEEVEWDAAASKAYVVRGEEKIDMSGKIVSGTTYIKVRDFEKLGYTVDYVSEDGVHTATVTKN